MLAMCTCDPSLRPKQHTATRWFTLVRRSLLPATPNHTQLKQLYLLHRHCICCTGTVSAAQALYLLHRHCICCTGTVSTAQALYLLHRHCSKNMFTKAVPRIYSKKRFSASLYSMSLCSTLQSAWICTGSQYTPMLAARKGMDYLCFFLSCMMCISELLYHFHWSRFECWIALECNTLL